MIKRSIRCSAKRVSVHPVVGSPSLRIPPVSGSAPANPNDKPSPCKKARHTGYGASWWTHSQHS